MKKHHSNPSGVGGRLKINKRRAPHRSSHFLALCHSTTPRKSVISFFIDAYLCAMALFSALERNFYCVGGGGVAIGRNYPRTHPRSLQISNGPKALLLHHHLMLSQTLKNKTT